MVLSAREKLKLVGVQHSVHRFQQYRFAVDFFFLSFLRLAIEQDSSSVL